MTFSALLSAIGIAPKTLPQASETLTAAKAQLDSVASLFTAAGLNLETMLAAGPDSLKAHITGLDNTAEVGRLTAEVGTLTGKLSKSESDVLALSEINTLITTAIGLPVAQGETTPAQLKTAFESHVAKQTTLALAKTGHPPAHVPTAATPVDDVTPQKTDTDKVALAALAEYETLILASNSTGDHKARNEYFAKNHAAIYRGMQLRRRN